MTRKLLAMAVLSVMATALSGCIIISDTSPGPKSVQVTTVKKDTSAVMGN